MENIIGSFCKNESTPSMNHIDRRHVFAINEGGKYQCIL